MKENKGPAFIKEDFILLRVLLKKRFFYFEQKLGIKVYILIFAPAFIFEVVFLFQVKEFVNHHLVCR